MAFSSAEMKDLTKAWVVISAAFAILLSGLESLFSLAFMFVISAFTVGIGFLLHELAHKAVAQHYGCFAEFRAFNPMLVLAIVMALFGFIFVAPGAVVISGYVNKERNGKIALAGPLVNMVLAVLFLIIFLINSWHVAYIGLTINSLLALFNMLPFGMFDGAKVFAWNKKVFAAAMVFAAVLFFSQYFV